MADLRQLATEALERAERATEGPWEASSRSIDVGDDEPDKGDYFLGWEIHGPPDAQRGQFARGHDAHFIAAARSDVPVLARCVLELLEQRDQARAVLERLKVTTPLTNHEARLLKAALKRLGLRADMGSKPQQPEKEEHDET